MNQPLFLYKKTLAILLGLSAAFLTTITPTTKALYTEAWEITNFHTSIYINDDSSLRVTETILADFTNERHHGIIRSIPYKYPGRFGTFKTIKLRLKEAVDGTNQNWKTSTSKEDGYYNIRIETDDGSFLTGPATFHITYDVEKAMNFFTAKNDNGSPEFFPHDELYWNATGTEWVVPIQNTTAEISYPIPVTKQKVQSLCYTGIFGSNEQNCKSDTRKETSTEFSTKGPLQPYEGLTTIIALPENTINPPSTLKKTAWFFADNWPLLMPLLVLFAMFILWYFKGRDPEVGNDTVIPHYHPPKGLRPTECGLIIDEKIHARDITATIIDLAVKGYIQIKETKNDHTLILLKDYQSDSKLLPFEKKILRGIFSEPVNKIKDTKDVLKLIKALRKDNKQSEEIIKEFSKPLKEIAISDLKNSFYAHVPQIKKTVTEKLIKDGYFPSSPAKTRGRYVSFGLGILIFSGYLGELIFAEFGPLMVGSIVVSGIIVVSFGYFMPRKTHKGRKTYYELKGLYEYMNTAEKDRMEFQEKANIFFEKLLPYAVSFALVKKWSKAFDSLLTQPPKWYTTSHVGHFNIIHFSNGINSLSNNLTTNLNSKPNNSGGSSAWSGGSGFSGSGGFSGGGFGGGGGRGI